MVLTTNDRLLLKKAGIEWDSAAEIEDRRLRARMASIDERNRLLRIQVDLIAQRDYWYRWCRRLAIALGLVVAVGVAWGGWKLL